jgi:hypothetical protein
MKYVVALSILVCLLFTGCMPLKVIAPTNSNVQLLSETDNASFKITKRAIYLIGGLIPISNTSTDVFISQYNLKNVKVETEMDIVDWLVTYITGSLVVTRSVTIESNAK